MAQPVDWKNGVTGSWFTPENWWGGAIPEAYNNVGIENGGDALSSNGGSVAVGETVNIGIGTQGTLRIEAGGTLRNNMSFIGNELGGNGLVHVTGAGSLWDASGTSPTEGGVLTVGLRGNGRLEIYAGATVQAKYGKIGAGVSGTGSADVGGLGTSFQLSEDLLVGESGHGSLTVHSAASASAKNVFLGFHSGGEGVASVAGAETTLVVTRSIYVGYGGSGTLDVNSGGSVRRADGATEDTLSVGHQTGAVGSVVVSGSGSEVDLRNILVGYQGSGTLAVSDQGRVSTLNGSVGHLAGSVGTATISGLGSSWHAESDLTVGNAGRGTLYVSDGASVTSATGHIGYVSTGTGEFYVDGEGSSWVLTGSLTVGRDGSGTLNVSNLGQVTSDTAFVGSGTGQGIVNVGGAGSLWNNADTLSVGHTGTGQLNVFSSGTVATGEVFLGHEVGGVGESNVLGAGSTLTVVGLLTVGHEGRGTLNVTTGGSVVSDDAFLGSETTGFGQATVTGENSSWNIDCLLFVGVSGTGQLNITLGGSVVTDEVSLGSSEEGVGEINVANTGSSLVIEGDLFVGDLGTGKLGLTGGHVSNATGAIGLQAGSTGTASVFSGTWTNTDLLTVGGDGDGTLEITGDGVVRVAGGTGDLLIASGTGSTGTLNIGAGDTTGSLQAGSVIGGAGDASVNFNHAGTLFFAPVLAGNLTVTKSGTGTTVFDHANTYAGVTRIQDGTLKVTNAAGSATGVSTIEIDFLGTLTGDGVVDGSVLVEGTISPGDGIGQLGTGSQIWGENGTYLWEIADAVGGGLEWDSLMMNGDLSFSSLEDHPFTLALTTLTVGGAAGLLANFDDTLNYAWTIASVTGEIFDWMAGQIVIDASGFENDYTGTFHLVRDGRDLNLLYNAIPEPSTWFLLGLSSAVLLWLPRRRRTVSSRAF